MCLQFITCYITAKIALLSNILESRLHTAMLCTIVININILI